MFSLFALASVSSSSTSIGYLFRSAILSLVSVFAAVSADAIEPGSPGLEVVFALTFAAAAFASSFLTR